MPNSYRECPQCGESIEGRPNKKFCSDTCKGRHFRENNSPIDDNSLSPRNPIALRSANYVDAEELELDWEEEAREDEERRKREAAEKKISANEEQATKLHEQFCDLVREFLENESKLITARPLDRSLRQVDQLTGAYRQHPYLKASDNSVRSRLKALYDIHDILQEVAQEIATKSPWQSKESSFEITKKWRKLLRELLIAD